MPIHWIPLTELSELDSIIARSHIQPVAIFKHSTRCSISGMVKRAIERDWNLSDSELPIYYLDLLEYRPISDSIAQRLSVRHESPQLILIRDGKATYHAAHSEIDVAEMSAMR